MPTAEAVQPMTLASAQRPACVAFLISFYLNSNSVVDFVLDFDYFGFTFTSSVHWFVAAPFVCLDWLISFEHFCLGA